jgi:hypothetical protein
VFPLAEVSFCSLHRPPDLALHLASPVREEGAAFALEGAPRRRATDASAPVCSGDVCQPVVVVPGYEPRYGRVHRSEAFVALLTRARLEPIATIAWALVSTGVRFDYTPVVFDGPNSGGHGWGSVFLRVRLRLNAYNTPVIPPRPR